MPLTSADPRRIAYIIGNGGHARVVASLLPHARIRFVVESNPGPDDLSQAMFDDGSYDRDGDYFVAIGNNTARRRWFDRVGAFGLARPPAIAPTAWIARDAAMGDGALIAPGAIVMTGARIGQNVIVNTMVSIDHDSVVGDDTQVAPGCSLGSRLAIGARCYFGMKACIIPDIAVGDDAVVMAGALVTKDVPPRSVVGGAPARVMQSVSGHAIG
jgi:sugar O-acyltransferase (sialic acid O-acetyltransferase NeuD family)